MPNKYPPSPFPLPVASARSMKTSVICPWNLEALGLSLDSNQFLTLTLLPVQDQFLFHLNSCELGDQTLK